MSLRPTTSPSVPDETARIARAAFPQGSRLLSLRDELGPVFDDQRFADLFPRLGRPAEAPWRLALVTLLQFAERLSDRQAADAVRSRIDWKYVLALPLADPGFDASVLCEFRTRLIAGGAEHRLFDSVLEIARARNLVRAGGRQRTDATHVLGAVRSLNRLACVVEAMRHALGALAVAAPAWLAVHARPHWAERYEPRGLAERQPRAAPERKALAASIGEDGHDLLSAAFSVDAPACPRQLPAVETLRRIWVQQFYLADGSVRWRETEGIPPASLFISSPYDLDAHYARKGTASWIGYKVHLTETCEDDQPRIITHVQTSAAPLADGAVTTPTHEALEHKGLLPAQHLVDTGYIDAGILVETRQRFAVDLIGPVRRDLRWQAKAGTGFSAEAFRVDWEQQRVTCPRGVNSVSWTPAVDNRATAVIKVKFSRRDCGTCGDRAACAGPDADRRLMTLRTQSEYEALTGARQRQQAPEFAAVYAWRAGVEATMSWAVRGFGLRRARYLGLDKVRLQHTVTAAALNLVRLTRWIMGVPIASTRVSPFTHLAQPAI
jgi:transposase